MCCVNLIFKIMPINITCETGSTTKNKTGGWRTYIPHTDLEKCISCGTCARVCPENCIKMISPLLSPTPLALRGTGNEGSGGGLQSAGKPKPAFVPQGGTTADKPKTDYNFCKGCGVCAAECPVKVIKMELEKK